MENIVKKMENKPVSNSKLTLENRTNLEITGVSKVVSVNENSAQVLINGTKLNIGGQNISIESLNVSDGTVKLSGTFDEFKYMGKSIKTSFFKRLFKWLKKAQFFAVLLF